MQEMNSILNQEFDPSSDQDFIDKMLSSMPQTWPDLTEAIDGGQKSSNEISCRGMQFPAGGGFYEVDDSVQALYNVYNGNTQLNGQTFNPVQHLHLPQDGMMQAQSLGQGGIAKQARQKVRARRGQATDPHSIAERLRRERIAERMKSLQELVPNANKTDKASMLEEIIDYVKFLQLQVKVLSTSRLGGPGAIAPLVADISYERTSASNGIQMASTSTFNNKDSVTITETQVAKLMEEDMGSAMQFLQGKGLCLMPISLATAISTATAHNPIASSSHRSNSGGSSSPSISGLTVQSAMLANRNSNAHTS